MLLLLAANSVDRLRGPYYLSMPNVTHILAEIEKGNSGSAEKLLPLVYDMLHKLAAAQLAREKPGQTLQSTALVHDAYLRLVDVDVAKNWDSRGHFYAAAAEAMRRILIERARQRRSKKRGGGRQKFNIDEMASLAGPDAPPALDLLALDEALREFEVQHPKKAQLVKLRYFAGLQLDEAARILNVSPATAKRYWVYARAWLHARLHDN